MKKLFILYILLSLNGNAQTISVFNPQINYNNQGNLFDADSLRELNLNFYNSNYHNTLVSSFFNNPSLRIPATLTLNGETYDSVGVRYKGNSTFCIPNDDNIPKVPYNIDMNYWVSGQKIMDYKKLKLANAYMDATFAREYIASEIYQNYLPSSEVNLLKLNVQGNYLGLYVNTESVNKQFLEKHFNEKNGALFKCDNADVFCGNNNNNATEPNLSWLGTDSTTYYDTYTIKSDHGWQKLQELIYTLNFNTNEIDSILNVDRVLWAFAVNTVIANFDTYNGYYVHNYYLYQSEDGLFQMIPWDLSQSFLNALLGWDIFLQPGDPDPIEFDPFFGDIPSTGRPLTAKLLNNPSYRKQYTAHIRTIMNDLDSTQLRSEINQVQNLAYPAALSDIYKLFSINNFSFNVENDLSFGAWGGYGFGGIMSTLIKRLNFLSNHSEINYQAPTINNVSLNDDLITAEIQNATSVNLMATINTYSSKFKSFLMNDNGTDGDLVSSDGIYSSLVPYLNAIEDVKFYIKAENNDALTLSPQRAEYEYYIISNSTSNTFNDDLIQIYPNPTKDQITIENNFNELTSFTLFNSLGQKIETGQINSSLFTINVSQLSSNIYFLKIGTNVYKVMKN
ncbi:MAG: CotH kinase family protein [Flavobacteriales bacterium]|nr:CotH kinase family protein [Flavobacteriales bacterium]